MRILEYGNTNNPTIMLVHGFESPYQIWIDYIEHYKEKGRFDMPYVEPEIIEQVRQIDLLTYLRKFEPDNVEEVKGTKNVYRTVDHDSLKISNGKWFWWSQGFGGYNALDYLIKVRNYSFMDAVEILTGKELANWTPPPKKEEKNEPKVLRLPENIKTVRTITITSAYSLESTNPKKGAMSVECTNLSDQYEA